MKAFIKGTALALTTCLSLPVWAASPTDASDQKTEDVIQYQGLRKDENKGKWLPIPIPVSNPEFGSGLAFAMLYMHPKDSPDEPATTTGAGAMYTDSDSGFVGAFHDDYWLEDRLRMNAFYGAADFNLDFYGTGQDSLLKDNPLPYNITGDVGQIKLLGKTGNNSDWYIGFKYAFTQGTVSFDFNNILPGSITEDLSNLGFSDLVLDADLTTSSIGFISQYDSRDDNFYPRTGHKLDLSLTTDDEKWGSDFNFQQLTSDYRYYWDATDKSTIALKAYTSVIDGDAPFYMLPSLNMLGFASSRYRDETVLSGHIEWRYKFHPRWALMTAFETGSVGEDFNEMFSTDWVGSIGAGIRWQVFAERNIHIGLDYGVSEDDEALYIQVGERF